ncbi:MAG: AAA family ATPase [Magnetococcales bacterium]|nr:AAA family ATPase [Magnetococcales bacterium]MBF0583606.1 AAA family ATPase [Magnetococcales bacterium]
MSEFADALQNSKPVEPDPESTAQSSRLFDVESSRKHMALVLTKPPPKREWVVNSWVPQGETGLLIGPGGSGKGIIAMNIGLCVATGKPVFGHETAQGSVCFLETEDDQNELDRRVHYCVAQKFTPSDHAAIQKNFIAKSMVAHDCRITQSIAGTVTPTDFANRIAETVRGIEGVRLVVISPLSRFNGGDENFSADATRFVEQLELVAKACGAAVLAVHHTNKANQASGITHQSAARGSSAFVDGVRFTLLLSHPNDKEARKLPGGEDERRNFIKLSLVKSNYGPPQPDIWLQRGPHGVLFQHVGPSVGRGASLDAESSVVAEIIKIVAANPQLTKTRLIDQFGGANGVLRTGEKALSDILENVVDAGMLTYLPGEIPGRRVLAVQQKPTRMEF